MPLSGTFDTIQLADIVQWIHSSNSTGTLTISVDTEETYLLFEKGDLVALDFADPIRNNIGQILLNAGNITEEQFRKALSKCESRSLFVDYLVEQKIASLDVINATHRNYAFESVIDLFFNKEGSFFFSNGNAYGGILGGYEAHDSRPLEPPIFVQQLLIEAMKRLDEWQRFKAVFPSSYLVVRTAGEPSEDPVWQLLNEENAPMDIGTLCLKFDKNRYNVYKSLFELHRNGQIVFDKQMSGREDIAPIGPVGVLVDNARLLLQEKQFDEAREVLATATALDPGLTEAKELLKSLRKDQVAYLYQQIPPYKVVKLALPKNRLVQFDLSSRESFIAARLTGHFDVATLIMATPLGELETLKILQKLLHGQIAKFV